MNELLKFETLIGFLKSSVKYRVVERFSWVRSYKSKSLYAMHEVSEIHLGEKPKSLSFPSSHKSYLNFHKS